MQEQMGDHVYVKTAAIHSDLDPSTWSDDYKQKAGARPYGAAVNHVHNHLSWSAPWHDMPLPEDHEEASGVLHRMLGEMGHPQADQIDIHPHPRPERGASNTAYDITKGAPKVELNPRHWDYGHLAHEAAHLMRHLEDYREQGDPDADRHSHGPEFMEHFSNALRTIHPTKAGADRALPLYHDALGRISDATGAQLSHARPRKTAAGGYDTQHYHVEGPLHRVIDKTPSGETHMMEYKHDGDQIRVKPFREGTPAGAKDRMLERMRQEHPDVPVSDAPYHSTPAPPEKPRAKTFYHGTTVAGVTHILPASTHGGHVTFPHDTSREHAYATTSKDDAWTYAQLAWDAADGDGGRPRVYQVRPIGGHKNVEKDPEVDSTGRRRLNFENDHRSKHGFEVVRELRMPSHMGQPEDWD